MKSDTTAMNETVLHGEEGIKKIGELIKGIRIAMFTTVTENGELHSRPMATQDTDFDGTLWFLTKIESEKIEEIREDQHVLLTFANDDKFVTIQGRAAVTRDKARIHQLWSPFAKAWFPQGEDDPSIAVIRVDTISAEYWEPNGIKAIRWIKMLTAAATNTIPDMGTHGKVA